MNRAIWECKSKVKTMNFSQDQRGFKRTMWLIVITMFFQCNNDSMVLKKPKLKQYLEYSYGLDLGFDPKSKVTYEYHETGELDNYAVFTYNPDTKSMEEQRFFKLSYSDQRVEYIRGYFSGENDAFVEYQYHYLSNGSISKITEKNTLTRVTGEADFTYSGKNISRVSYTYSNGDGFVYEPNYMNGNIVTDRIMRGADLCSMGQCSYDQQINPFKELGFVDFQLLNLSSNNKVMETTTYENCYFPSFIPESHVYEYDMSGYPQTVVTLYKGHQKYKTRKEFFYN